MDKFTIVLYSVFIVFMICDFQNDFAQINKCEEIYDSTKRTIIDSIFEDKKVYDPYNNCYIAGAKGDIKYLDNNEYAKDVSYSEVISFVLKDDTDKIRYDYSSFICTDYAEMLHNNAEVAGIKCAFVSISTNSIISVSTSVNGVTMDNMIFDGGHALNAFNTTDKGLIFIDCTGSLDESSMDCIASIEEDGIYYTQIYNDYDYDILPMYMDIKNIEVIW